MDLNGAKARRGQMKAQVTRCVNAIPQYIAEDDLGKVKLKAEMMKDAFMKFEEAHEVYYNLLEVDAEVEECDRYFFAAQTSYITALNLAKDYIFKQSPEPDSKLEAKIEKSEASQLCNFVDRMNLPKVEFEVFSGDPLKYKSFMAVFDEHVHRSQVEDSMKLSRLLQFTSGKARDAIRPCTLMRSAEAYEKARDILERRFGNHHIISDIILKQLKCGKQIRNSTELQEFSDDLNNHYATLASLDKLREVDTQSCILDVVNRLQPYIRNHWRKYLMDCKRKNDLYPSFGELVEFVTRQAEDANDPISSQIISSAKHSSYNPTKSTTSCLSSDVRDSRMNDERKKIFCVACKQDHRLFYCQKFKEMKLTERLQLVKDHKLCENCLMSNHLVSDCRKPSVCSVPGCGLKHTKFIHVNERQRNNQPSGKVNVNRTEVENASVNEVRSVCVPIVSINVNDKCHTNALLDTASTSSFCTRRLIDKIGVTGTVMTYNLSTISQSDESKNAEVVSLSVKSLDGSEMIKLPHVYVIENIPACTPAVNVNHYPHLCDLPISDVNGNVDLLIGQDCAEALIPLDTRRGEVGDPFAVRTLFGWSINGPVSSSHKVSRKVIANFVSTSQIEKDVQILWDIENEGVSKDKVGLSVEDQIVLELWNSDVVMRDGHYELPIPFKRDAKFPNNFSVALSRLSSLKTSLIKRGLMSRYDEEIIKLCVKNYAEKIPLYEATQKCTSWYLPHQAVTSDSKPGKLRVVFDCSSRYQGESLNDKCLQGPDINNKLFHVLLRFRNHRYAITADIEAMYYQVRVPPVHRDFLRFLWFDEKGNLEQYRMLVHVFGGVWSGSAAAYALQKTVVEFGGSDLVSDTVRNAFYVDDCLVSVEHEEDARSVVKGVKTLLQNGGFNITKFVVNDENILSLIPEDDRASEVRNLQSDCQSKALGVKWKVKSDSIHFDVNFDASKPVTRRAMLSTASSMFDPLGLVTPVLIKGKILFQDATCLGLSWDESVPLHLMVAWRNWIQSFDDLKEVQIQRCVKPSEFDDSYLELHHFSDANERAYGCCSYLRCVSKNGQIHTALLCSKGRVSPLKTVSIPRLELQAAVLAVRMDSMLREQLHLQLGQSRFWVDSEIVIKYIVNESQRFHVYVSNRVSEIRSLSHPKQWSHVSGVLNPADMITRGVEPRNLMSTKWIDGPAFLRVHKSEWELPDLNSPISPDDPEVKSEKRVKVSSKPNVCASEVVSHPIDMLVKHHSSWYRLKRAVAWLLRLKRRLSSGVCEKGPLSVEEIKVAEVTIISHVQGQSYSQELKQLAGGKGLDKSSCVRDLLPVLDSVGQLRVGGRVGNASLHVDNKHPLIIPHRSPIAILIARESHNVAHLGTEWTLGLIRRRYWITKARCILKSVKKECLMCKRLYGLPGYQRMADLPEERLMPGKPAFSFVGTDCFGPILVKLGRSQVKRYGCAFTCFTTRAVHIEVLSSLDTDSMINALRRFIARRGSPIKIWSDNATNYVGCHNEMSKSLKQLKNDQLYAFCTKQAIEWNFNTPYSPHKGGVFERIVKTIKRVLVAVLENARLTDEILYTVVCEVENLVNSRPITKISEDACDPEALSPNHLLIFNGGPAPIPGVFDVSDVYRKRWRHAQHLIDIFWKRWIREYLPQLHKASKWFEIHKNLKVNDLVLIVDEATPRGLWPMGIVTNVKLGDDKLVRTVHVRTKSTEMVRPVTKIVLLEEYAS